MNWLKILIIIALFYFFALLQSSFFAHFRLFGEIPNLVFIFFFLIVFFSEKIDVEVVFYGITAGFFLDIFTNVYFGLSMVLMIFIAYIAKKIQTSFRESKEKFPFAYFLPIFLACLLAYELFLMLYLRFLGPFHTPIIFDLGFFAGIIYNLVAGSVGFYIYKKCLKFTK